MVPGIMLETSNPAADSLVQVLYVVHTVRIPEVVLTVYQVLVPGTHPGTRVKYHTDQWYHITKKLIPVSVPGSSFVTIY